jgi:CheY-like chemotaxis protein
MKCPKCSESFTGVPDEQGFYVCPKCGARLKSRSAPTPAPLPAAAPAGDPPASLEAVLSEVRVVRRAQEEILALLRSRPAASSAPPPARPASDAADDADDTDDAPAAPSPQASVRARRRKTVLLVDDQDDSLQAALAALEQAQVPTRSVTDGNACLAAIAAEKPDVMVIELAMGGSMAGKDVINMIKATMEWVDIPIVLYTRLPIESQKEARTIHGADELVPKGDGSPAALVARVIAIFRRA